MPEEQKSVTLSSLIREWLPLAGMIFGWVYFLGQKDKSADFVQLQVNELRDAQKEIWKQVRENVSSIVDQKAKIEYIQRELEQERQVRDARR